MKFRLNKVKILVALSHQTTLHVIRHMRIGATVWGDIILAK